MPQTTATLKAASGLAASRISELCRALGIRGQRGGRTGLHFTVEEMIKIVLAGRLRALRVSLDDAAAIVRGVTQDDLVTIIETNEPHWLVVGDGDYAELVGVEGVLRLASEQEHGLAALRLVSVHQVIRDVYYAKLADSLDRHAATPAAPPELLN